MNLYSKFNQHKLGSVLAMLFTIFMLANPLRAELPGKGKTVRPITNNTFEESFWDEIISIGLKRLGYTIAPIKELEITTMHVAMGQGEGDYCAHHAVPMHNTFYERAGGDKTMVKIGPFEAGNSQQYFIDKKTAEQYDIHSFDQLKDPNIAKIFDEDGDGKADLTGCNPGWGCEREIENHLKCYELTKTVTHQQGTYFALIADTIQRYKSGQPILYYLWEPMWVSSILVPGTDVVPLTVPFTCSPPGQKNAPTTILADGRNTGFSVIDVYILANKNFIDENPAAKKFFELLNIPTADTSKENLLIHQGEKTVEDVKRHAKQWVEENQEKFDGWISEALKASQ
ncbi:glycine betaine/L-proline ABC transporter substrate-binding protein ProX [Desulforhopalus singaporensis]|uniref:Glycine betaine/proline transport system substrate-binding protein n=1 Tax=Desulforhopalus singaporensis TaxID=91360 RepID=A0A1H0VUI5_9BACT|nr:glycine betaine/L-proline ABC transporter substrate-binding protein ProX [Desulforhopalus singaporensis]SDP82217.1 glycine betaine/proline transport system substrate-binding protein [Desulforhopalus singaporensis]